MILLRFQRIFAPRLSDGTGINLKPQWPPAIKIIEVEHNGVGVAFNKKTNKTNITIGI